MTPADENTDEDSPAYTEDNHSLMQRGSDIAFLRMLARRSGKVSASPAPISRASAHRLLRRAEARRRSAVANLAINDDANWTVNALDLEWDATRPTAVTARSALFSDADPDARQRRYRRFRSRRARPIRRCRPSPAGTMTVLLATAVDSAGALAQRAQGVLREAGWFAVRGRGGCRAARRRAARRHAGQRWSASAPCIPASGSSGPSVIG